MIESLAIIIVLSHVAVVALVASSGESPTTPNYFAVDIDYTFFTVEENTLSKNITAFHRAREPGNTLFFCTGRAYAPNASYISPLFSAQTGYNGCPGVYCNGALVLDKECNVLQKVAFDKEVTRTILDFVVEKGYQPYTMFSDGQRHYTLSDSVSFAEDAQRRGRLYDTEKSSVDKILSMEILKIHFANWINVQHIGKLSEGVDYTAKTSKSTIVLSPPGVTKARGVVALCEHFAVDPKDVGFIGDGLNDIEMMQLSDHSYAVGNAVAEVKQSAKNVLDTTYDQGAFAEAMALVYHVPAD